MNIAPTFESTFLYYASRIKSVKKIAKKTTAKTMTIIFVKALQPYNLPKWSSCSSVVGFKLFVCVKGGAVGREHMGDEGLL